ncbi:hypothetical protein BGZ81_003564 [Podila clonocystis]|nr:hypothetical protein BGZ81_003564 [Podila clonocystis]
MSFGVAANQIRGDEVGATEELARDNFKAMFADLKLPELMFDNEIDSVIMVPFNEFGVKQISSGIVSQEKSDWNWPTAVRLEIDISERARYAGYSAPSFSTINSPVPVSSNDF